MCTETCAEARPCAFTVHRSAAAESKLKYGPAVNRESYADVCITNVQNKKMYLFKIFSDISVPDVLQTLVVLTYWSSAEKNSRMSEGHEKKRERKHIIS